jgi:hypothetical protein
MTFFWLAFFPNKWDLWESIYSMWYTQIIAMIALNSSSGGPGAPTLLLLGGGQSVSSMVRTVWGCYPCSHRLQDMWSTEGSWLAFEIVLELVVRWLTLPVYQKGKPPPPGQSLVNPCCLLYLSNCRILVLLTLRLRDQSHSAWFAAPSVRGLGR